MNMLVNIGFGNMVASAKLVAIVSPDAAPVRRLIQNARSLDRCVDATQGRRTKAVLIMEPDYIVLSALVPDTLAKRFQAGPGDELYAADSSEDEGSEAEKESTEAVSAGAEDVRRTETDKESD